MNVRAYGRHGRRRHHCRGLDVMLWRNGVVVLKVGNTTSMGVESPATCSRNPGRRRLMVHWRMPVHGRHRVLVVWRWTKTIAVRVLGRGRGRVVVGRGTRAWVGRMWACHSNIDPSVSGQRLRVQEAICCRASACYTKWDGESGELERFSARVDRSNILTLKRLAISTGEDTVLDDG